MDNITQQIFISRKKIFFSRFSIVPAGKFSNFRKKKCCYAVNIYPGVVSDSAGNLHNNRNTIYQGWRNLFSSFALSELDIPEGSPTRGGVLLQRTYRQAVRLRLFQCCNAPVFTYSLTGKNGIFPGVLQQHRYFFTRNSNTEIRQNHFLEKRDLSPSITVKNTVFEKSKDIIHPPENVLWRCNCRYSPLWHLPER